MLGMKRSVFFCTAFSAACAALAAPTDSIGGKAPAGTDSVRIVFSLADKSVTPKIHLSFANRTRETISVAAGDVTEPKVYVSYQQRANYIKANGPIPTYTFRNQTVSFKELGVNWHCRPNPHWYNCPISPQTILAWEKTFPDALKTQMTFEARKAGDDVEFYVNGQYAGRRRDAHAVVSAAVTSMAPTASGIGASLDDIGLDEDGPKFDLSFFTAETPSRFVRLGRRGPQHAGAILKKDDAAISLTPGVQDVGGVTMEVFPVAESIDPSLHRNTMTQGDLHDWRYGERNGYTVCPEYSEWTVPKTFYAAAWVLCADVPQAGRAPYVGVQISCLYDIGGQGIRFSKVDLDGECGAKTVGELTWIENGEKKTSPLKLVRVPLDIGAILDLVNDKPLFGTPLQGDGKLHRLGRPLGKVGDYIDFEFNGAPWGRPASSVQIFGVTLEKSPFGAEMVQSEFGNLFFGDEKRETGVEVTALEDGSKGTVDYEIYDEAFAPLRTGTFTIDLAKKGEKQVFTLDLDMKTNGWYGLDFVFRNAAGDALFRHEAAFAILGADTREAGYDTRFACWPHNGRHNSQSSLEEIAKKMWKLGLTRSWEPPCRSEEDPWAKQYKITMSGPRVMKSNPPGRTNAEGLAAYLDEIVAEAQKDLRNFPHATKTIQLLHESGGRELAPEMLYKPAVRNEYRGIEGDWTVYFCTEFCKRMHAEFPGFGIYVGNGSSASERVASLCRAGFDLDLVDMLGIESKGFQTMPEFNANLEAPGMLWALRETGRRFGFTNFTMNACSEYMFRPERGIPRTASKKARREVADWYVRDGLISLGHGVISMSYPHLEDALGNYYNTNWGAGPLCRRFPYGYPKRCAVAVATLTKVMDCIERYPRRIPTGEVATYMLEWRRNRKVKDYAAAFWTPSRDARMRVKYPTGTKVTHVSFYGVETPVEPDAEGWIFCNVGSSANYFISSAPAERAEVVEHVRESDAGFEKLMDVNTETVEIVPLVEKPKSYPMVGKFTHSDAADAQLGKVLMAQLVKRPEPLPEVVWEYEHVRPKKPVAIDSSKTKNVGLWVKGNGSFATLRLGFKDAAAPNKVYWVDFPDRNAITFHGWHFLVGRVAGAPAGRKLVLETIQIASSALALDPIEMRPVTEPVGIGPVMVRSNDGGSAAADLTEEDARRFDTMHAVADKDLAGKQLAANAQAAEAKPATSPTPTVRDIPDDEIVDYLLSHSRDADFVATVSSRIEKAYRRDPENCFKAKRREFVTDDLAVAALCAWMQVGLPEAKAAKGREGELRKMAEIAKFADELGWAAPDSRIKVPAGVFASFRRGEGGHQSIVLVNFTDKPASGEFELPQDFGMQSKKDTKAVDLMTGRMFNAVNGRVFKYALKPRGYTVLRTNSAPLGSAMPGMDEGLDPDVADVLQLED